MTKPIHTNLTQEQRNTCVAAAIASPEGKLVPWVTRVLLDAAKRELSRCNVCGKTDYDDSAGCEKPSVFSAGVGDWSCGVDK
jgi:hypothetical protein